MKILVVDYLSYPGHKRFNKIHIDALEKLGHDLFFVGKKDQFPDYCQPRLLCVPPERFFKTLPFQSVSSRLQNIFCLKWIYSQILEHDYDLILFPTYDIVSLFFSPFKSKCLVINHNNVSQLNSRVKVWLTRHLSPMVNHVTLDSLSQNRLLEIAPKAKVFMIPHGFDSPTCDTSKPAWLDCGCFFFCPVNRNFNSEDIKTIFQDSSLEKVLAENGCRIYIKNFCGLEESFVLRTIPTNVPQKEYDYMIQNAKAVILPYSSSFRYRVSGIFFECVAANTTVIVPNIESFKQYSNFNVVYYSDAETFVRGIRNVLNMSPSQYDLSKVEPLNYWRTAISQIMLNERKSI